jgi:hypothetical protein
MAVKPTKKHASEKNQQERGKEVRNVVMSWTERVMW